jgi:hypothetical protein
VGALADAEVGRYMNRHFVSAFQKVATFQIAGNQKQGGNVASYFCTPEGLVLHAVAGPVHTETFLREARWANESFELARLENHHTPAELRGFFRKAHLERLQNEHGVRVPILPLAQPQTKANLSRLLEQNGHLGLREQGQVHLLLAVAPLPRLNQTYQVVFERILNEKISTNPVALGGR